MPHKYGKSTRQGKKKILLNQQDLAVFVVVFNKTIIPLALVGFQMIIALRASLAICHLVSIAGLWNKRRS